MKTSSWVKRILPGALAALLLLAGCSTLTENNDISDLPALSAEREESGSAMRTITPSLYFLDENQTKLVAESRELIIGSNESDADVIITTLLEGPKSPELKRLASGITLDYIELMGEVANVYVKGDWGISEERAFTLATAITDTMTDYFGMTYVCVYLDGEIITVSGYPCGVMKKSSGNVQELYNEYITRYSDQYYFDGSEHELNVVLYFPDETGTYILPEVRTVSLVFSGDLEEFRQTMGIKLLEELAKGPTNIYYLATCVNKTAIDDISVSIGLTENNRFSVYFAKKPFISETGETFGVLESASVYYTLSASLNGTYRMKLKHSSTELNMSRSLAKMRVGRTISLYLPDSDMLSLVPVSRTVYAGAASDPKTYIKELMRGPLGTDSAGVTACVTEDMDINMLNSIEVRGDVVYVDFTESFADAARSMTENEERMMFYSFINTLCSITKIRSVQFLIDGHIVDDIGGKMHLEFPLMENPGLL